MLHIPHGGSEKVAFEMPKGVNGLKTSIANLWISDTFGYRLTPRHRRRRLGASSPGGCLGIARVLKTSIANLWISAPFDS